MGFAGTSAIHSSGRSNLPNATIESLMNAESGSTALLDKNLY